MLLKRLLFILFIFTSIRSIAQDVEFHVNTHLFPGKNVLKAKRDFNDPYLWVLAQDNEVYRINSLTLTVDDYTSQFAAYSNLEFIDIAGRSKDTVFIATKSPNVIEYKKGIIKIIGTADGMRSVVNSIGISKRLSWETNNPILLIGSDQAFYTYDIGIEKLTDNEPEKTKSSQIYEATYRDLTFKDSTATYPDWDGRKYVPMFSYGEFTVFGHFAAESDVIGLNINTAYETWASIYDYDDRVSYSSVFWGTRNGLFQFNGNLSYFVNRDYGHYLDGIKVNKITSMFGLTSFGSGWWFGNKELIKQTLLIGTDKGFYYSNSIYQVYDPNLNTLQRLVTLFHFDALGNVIINDVAVNNLQQTEPICDDGVWVSAQNGLYLLKPDYGKYLTAKSIKAIQFEGLDESVTETQICNGTTVIATINNFAYSGHTIQWYKDGKELPGEISNKLQISSEGSYSAVVYDPCQNIHLDANTLKVKVITSPTVTLNYPDDNFYCKGTSATFKVDENPNYQYRWYTNGVLNGNESSTITVTENGSYKVEASACSGVWVSSKTINATFISLPSPVLTANKNAYCQGDQADITVNVPINTNYTINWLRDGVPLTANNDQTHFVTDVAGNYTVTLSNNKITCTETSAALPVSFNAPPSITIEKVINTTLCSGQTVDLKATISGGTVSWSTGETGNQISVKNPGSYKASVTSAAGCSTESSSVEVHFFDNPTLNLQDATLCQFTKEQVTLNAPPGFAKYLWNGQTGGDSFTTGTTGTVELTVIDKNGCMASQTITIGSHCDDVQIPNTFTPNGDGRNDTWFIEGLDDAATVKVYNRLGTMVFESRGYRQPWNGAYKGYVLPSGTYYYVINAKAGSQVLSGWVQIIH